MQCFFVQIKAQLGRAYEVADALARREVASEIYSTSGEWDLHAKFYVEDDVDAMNDLEDDVKAKIDVIKAVDVKKTPRTT